MLKHASTARVNIHLPISFVANTVQYDATARFNAMTSAMMQMPNFNVLEATRAIYARVIIDIDCVCSI